MHWHIHTIITKRNNCSLFYCHVNPDLKPEILRIGGARDVTDLQACLMSQTFYGMKTQLAV
ncbi:hypothetical protein EJB05_29163, partial [Eragrostis curvula]